jgi:N-acetylneuraminic acid mutarotase
MAKDAPACPVRGAGPAGRSRVGRVPRNLVTGVRWSPLLAFLVLVHLLALAVRSAAQETWTPTGTAGAPDARTDHTAVWTGSKMIVWGGFWFDCCGGPTPYWNTGGLYDPGSDTWTPTSTVGAPSGRGGHTAIWTGSKMIVWGGQEASGNYVSTGATYDPVTDTWAPMSTVAAPEARVGHTAVWTGSKMIIWGGVTLRGIPGRRAIFPLNTGATYDPSTDTWTPTSTVEAPAGRDRHTAVWTGSTMIIWGGWGGQGTPAGSDILLNTGGMYNPIHDTWTPTTTVGAPMAREAHTAVWAGLEMIIWGGSYTQDVGEWPEIVLLNTGAAYSPSTGTWTPTSTTGAPEAREDHTAVWTGSKMIVWGGNVTGGALVGTGAIYEPGAEGTDAWAPTGTVGAPSGRAYHKAVWTGSKMIVWGGADNVYSLSTGGVYSNPALLPTPPPPADFYTVTPCRLVDTRNAATGGPALYPGATRSFLLTGGACGIPSTATAVSANVTVTQPAALGHLTLYRGDVASSPVTSNINFSAGITRANNAIIVLAPNVGTINVANKSAGSVHFVLDVNGYYQ